MHGQIRRVLVAGHLGLDASLQGLPSVSDAHQEIVRDATLAAFERLIESALEQAVDAVVFHGTLLASEPTLRACATFRDGVETLLEEGIEVVWAVQKSSEKQQLESVRCLPRDLTLLTPQEPHANLFEPADGERSAKLVSCDLMDGQTFPSKDWAWTEERTALRIGFTQKPVGHLSAGVALNEHQDRYFRLVLSGHSDKTYTSRHQQTIYHAPGSLQGLDASRTGSCSVTLIKIDERGEVELSAIETSVVRYEQREILLQKGSAQGDWLETAELEYLDLISRLEQSPSRLLQIEWLVRGPANLVKSWNSEELAEQLNSLFEKTDQGVPVLHLAQVVPLMTGRELSSQEFLDDQLEEQYLQQLGEQISERNNRNWIQNSFQQLASTATGNASFPWQKLQSETDLRAIGNRAAELGVRSLQEQSRAG